MKKNIKLMVSVIMLTCLFSGCGKVEKTEEDMSVEMAINTESHEEKEAMNAFSAGTVSIELPVGWEEEKERSGVDKYSYAPGGDFLDAGCMVSITEKFIGDSGAIRLENFIDESQKEAFASLLGGAVSNYEAIICETGLGKAAKISCDSGTGDSKISMTIYVILSEQEMYQFSAIDSEYETESAKEALEHIMETGKITE